ncbi:MAG: hypothetical protein Q8Q14_03125 [Gemmatimonadales bacterium]|nr:hypothetical protein [Gemmatimonadales bacterium]
MSRTALLAGAFDRVVSIGRRTGPTTHAKLVQRVVDFAALGDLGPVNDVCCCLGTTIKRAGSQDAFRQVDHDYVVALAQAAQRSGATQLLLVAMVRIAEEAPRGANVFEYDGIMAAARS